MNCGTTTSGTNRHEAIKLILDEWVEQAGQADAIIAKLRHDLANAECAARLIEEAYDRMVLKYEAQLTALRESVDKLTTG